MSIKEKLKARAARKKIQKAAYEARKRELEAASSLSRAEKEEKLKQIAFERGIKGADWKVRLKKSVGDRIYKKLSSAWEIREFEQAAYAARKAEVSAGRREAKIEAAKRRGIARAERQPVKKIAVKSAVAGGKAAITGGRKALTAFDKWMMEGQKASKPVKKSSATYKKFNGERFKRVGLKKLKSEAIMQRDKLVKSGNKVRVVKLNGMWEIYSRKK